MANFKLNSVLVASESGGTVTLDSATVVPAAGITGTIAGGVTIPAAGVTGVLPVGVTGGSGLDAIPAAGITGTLPNVVQDNITRLGTVTSGTVPSSLLSASGTASGTTFLRGDNSWTEAGSTDASDLDTGLLPMARLSGALPSAVTYPAGHTIKTHSLQYRITSTLNTAVSTTLSTVTHASPGGAMSISGITATEGNLLHLSAYAGSPKSLSDNTYEMILGFVIDGVSHAQLEVFQSSTYSFWNGHIGMIYTVPASFTSKTITVAARNEGGPGTFSMSLRASREPQTIWMLISEIQQ